MPATPCLCQSDGQVWGQCSLNGSSNCVMRVRTWMRRGRPLCYCLHVLIGAIVPHSWRQQLRETVGLNCVKRQAKRLPIAAAP